MQRERKQEWGFVGGSDGAKLKEDAIPTPEKPQRRSRKAKPQGEAE